MGYNTLQFPSSADTDHKLSEDNYRKEAFQPTTLLYRGKYIFIVLITNNVAYFTRKILEPVNDYIIITNQMIIAGSNDNRIRIYSNNGYERIHDESNQSE